MEGTEYAAAFFLLADHLQDAVNVCLNQIKDLQLAIAVARVYEGDHGPILRKLLEEEVLAIAAQEGNRWLASWAFWMLHRRDMAVRALIVSGVLSSVRFVRLTHELIWVLTYRRLSSHSWRHHARRISSPNFFSLTTQHWLCSIRSSAKRHFRHCEEPLR